jgi:UDP-N-acetylmuramyl pentapeptide synthase
MKKILKNIIVVVLEIQCRLILKKYKPYIITVTGSVGKTSTKDAIYSVLASGRSVRRSEKSLNTEVGVPLTIIGCENPWGNLIGWFGVISHGVELIIFKSEFPKTLILEVGADRPGDVRRIARWLRPDIAVVTKIGEVPVHIEFFKTRAELVAEDLALPRIIKKDGTLVLPADIPDILAIRKDNPVKALTYGVDVPADVTATGIETLYENEKPSGVAFKLNYAGNSIPMRLKDVLGVQHVYPIVAAVAVGIARGNNLSAIVNTLTEHKPPRGRMNILQGINESTIIDDSYNSAPDAMISALNVLREIRLLRMQTGVNDMNSGFAPRKIAVLGDMMELGKFSPEEHKKVGIMVAEILKQPETMGENTSIGSIASMNLLVTVGQRAKMIREAALKAGMPEAGVLSYDSSAEAGAALSGLIKKGDLVLVKGSQSPRLERVVAPLLAEPERAGELLVRQDPEWISKK